MITVLQPGLLTTLQDEGRLGYQKYGVPVAGAMDSLALHTANLLAGNDMGEACLEITGLGPTLRFETPVAFALSGGEFSPTLDGVPLEMNRAYSAPRGSVLQVGACKGGFRCYLAVNGGFDVPLVMNSRSTYLKGSFGGFEGRAIQKGDTLPLREPQFWLNAMDKRSASYPLPEGVPVIHVIMGPQDDCFSPRGKRTFLQKEYTLGQSCDRMGYRLEGPAIERSEGFDGNILSDGVAMGSVQVPDGTPLIMMADRQTTGGYGKIATVVSFDLPVLAQCRPGDRITFAAITTEEAHQEMAKRRRALSALRDALEMPPGLW